MEVKLVFKIKDKEIELTLEEAKELISMLNGVIGVVPPVFPYIPPYPITPYYGTPLTPWCGDINTTSGYITTVSTGETK